MTKTEQCERLIMNAKVFAHMWQWDGAKNKAERQERYDAAYGYATEDTHCSPTYSHDDKEID